MTKNILVFSYLQRHLKKIIPLVSKFLAHSEINLTLVIMTEEEKQIAEKEYIPYRMLDEFTNKPRINDFDLGWGLEPLINAIDEIRPDLFLVIEVNYILRNAIRYCKQLKIPNMVVQHGTPNKYSLHAFAPFEGDIFAAWGEFTKDFLVDNGVNQNKIVVTGGIPFDHSIQMNVNRFSIADELSIDTEKQWVLFTTQGVGAGNRPTPEEIHSGIMEVAKFFSNKPLYQLIFQVHPGQTIQEVKEIVDNVSLEPIVIKYPDTEQLIAVCERMITFFSTTAIDAIVMKKPLMLINFSNQKEFYPFVAMDVALGANSKDEIMFALSQFVEFQATPDKLLQAAEYVNYKNDGQALSRVMELCYSQLDLK